MYGYNNASSKSNEPSYHFPGDFLNHSNNDTVPVVQVDCLMIPNSELESSVSKVCNYTSTTSSGCSSSTYASPSSLTQPPSTYSFHNNINAFHHYHKQLMHFSAYDDSSPLPKPSITTANFEGNNMVQQHHLSESPLLNESSIIECMNAKACKYSPEEKKEKIEKYRSKRNHRNFNKKIKYVCRKTLADSRPRIRGRFAKNNDENEKGGQLIDEWNHIAADNHGNLQEDNELWINFVDAFSTNVIRP